MVRRLERWGLSRAPAVIFSVLLAGLAVGAIGYTFTGQLADLAGNFRNTGRRFQKARSDKACRGGPFSPRSDGNHFRIARRDQRFTRSIRFVSGRFQTDGG